MTNISSKLFQKAITKGLKTTLLTTSTMALMLGSSGVFGAGAGVNAGVITANDAAFSDLEALGNWHEITNIGVDTNENTVGPNNNEAFTYGGDHIVTADVANRIIQAVNVAGANSPALVVTQNTSIGSIITGANLLPITVNDATTLTLTGTAAVAAAHGFDAAANDYSGLGPIILNGATGTLIIEAADGNPITVGDVSGNKKNQKGLVVVNTPTNFRGHLDLNNITFNANSNVARVIWANNLVEIGAANVNAGYLIFAREIMFTADGQLTAHNGIHTANVTNHAPNTGTLIINKDNILDAGTEGSELKQVTFNNTAPSTAGNLFATNITIGNAGTNVTTGTVNGDISFTAAGTLNAGGVITGDIVSDFGGNVAGGQDVIGTVELMPNAGTVTVSTISSEAIVNGGTLIASDVTGEVTVGGGTLTLRNAENGINFAAGADAETTVTVRARGNVGNVDNLTGAAGKGTLTFQSGGIAHNIGATNSLAIVNIGAGELTVNGATMQADAINLTNGASILKLTNAATLMTGDINFTANGTVNVANGATIDGNIDNTGAADNGIVNFQNDGFVGGNIGNTAAIKELNIAAGAVELRGDIVNVNTIALQNDDSILHLRNDAMAVTGDIDFTANGTINVANGATINGHIDNNDLINNNGTINFLGNGIITGLVAGNTNMTEDLLSQIYTINIQGAADTTVALQQNVWVENLVFDNANGAGTLQIGGNLEADNIDFGVGGILEFNGYNESDFKGVIANGANATLNVNTQNLTAYHPSIGTVATINIRAESILVIDASGGDITILNNQVINFAKDAGLQLQNSSTTSDRTITLGANLNANDEDVVILNSVEADRKLTIAGNVALGGANKFKIIFFKGAGDFDITDITLNTTNIVVATTSVLELGATPANVMIWDAQLVQTGDIGGFLDFEGQNGTVTLNDGVNIVGAVQNTANTNTNNGTLIALGASNLGSVNNIAMLKAGAGAVTIGGAGGDIEIDEIQGNGTELLTLPANSNLYGSINFSGGDALQLSFSGNSSVSGVVGTAANPVGNITTTGTTRFANTVNSNGAMTLARDSVTTFAQDVNATSFKADGATVEFDDNLALNGDITGSGTTLNLGANQVTYTGKGSFTDVLTLNTTFDGAAKSGGNILIAAGSNLNLSQVSNLNIVVNAINVDINDIDPNTKYTVISAETAGDLNPAPTENVKITVDNDNRFVGFAFDTSSLTLLAKDETTEKEPSKDGADKSSLTLSVTDITDKVIEQDFAKGGELANIAEAAIVKKSFELMNQAPNGSDARKALNNFGLMTSLHAADAVNNLRNTTDTVTACSQAVSGNILGNLTSINARINTTQAAAMAAGDEDMNAQFGAWINPFIANTTQKKIQNISGYKSDTTGGTLGFDSLINDDAVLGLAYTRAETDVKMKDAKQGDKNKVRSNIFSLYGLYNLPQSNFFVEGVASYGDSKVTSKSRRIVSVNGIMGYQTATGKYKSENYTGQLIVGYSYAIPENINITPMAGIRYSDIKDKGYKETGATFQNLIVKGKSYNTFDGLAGAKLSSSINVGEVALTPEAYAMVDYAFKNKAPAIDARLQGMAAPFPTNSFKPKKTSFDLGTGVTIKHKMVEYGVNYDVNIGNKYFAQQGSVKVRVNL
ncbi:MAG TPA: autotransporter outer membrane beta-barrel domain-containing protein [Rickettsia endosymbiont of Pyrocoelia pectoralis]|nr:autotransporter outer membrane beta-barrel domain-containing protein [Rickettsia endosymbiont of Pyrocoelia pectoralis]